MLSYYILNEMKRKAVIDVEKNKIKSWNGFETVKPSLEGKVVMMSIAVRAHNILMHSRIKQSSDPYKSLSSGTTTNFESHLALSLHLCF